MKRIPLNNRLSRRAFITLSSHCVLGVMLTTSLPCFARQIPAANQLSLYHTHTDEQLTINLGDNSPDMFSRVDRFLRDFRTGEVHAIDPRLLEMLCRIKELSGSSGTFEIISGFRSIKTNSMLRKKSDGVAKKSLHMTGRALDIRLSDLSTRTLRDIAQSLKQGGVGYYSKSDFVHIDTGRIRTW